MRACVRLGIIFAMNSPARSSKILLIADRREPTSRSVPAPVRRYRLARVSQLERPPAPTARPRIA
jgi:hypothetical protein